MKTISFIGSDKNAGKTTALNFYYRLLRQSGESSSVCLASIGINGEDIDSYEHRSKPSIRLFKGSCFVTAAEHLQAIPGRYHTLHCFKGPGFTKTYVLGRVLLACELILEGPNERNAVIRMKKVISDKSEVNTCLLDGSIDRQFLGSPQISDEICFALLLSDRQEQLQKARELIDALRIPRCDLAWQRSIGERNICETRSLYFDHEGSLIYQGKEVPFLDESLKQICLDLKKHQGVLYLNGALSRSLHQFLSPFENLTVILDNFTCYQNISTDLSRKQVFKPRLEVLEAVPIREIFIKQDRWESSYMPLVEVPALNLFRDDLDGIRI